jgi:hypothetical protein
MAVKAARIVLRLLWVLLLSFSGVGLAAEIDKGVRFIDNGDGTVLDQKSGLMRGRRRTTVQISTGKALSVIVRGIAAAATRTGECRRLRNWRDCMTLPKLIRPAADMTSI